MSPTDVPSPAPSPAASAHAGTGENPAPVAVKDLRLNSPVTDLVGVGPGRARLLARLEIHTVSDLLRHLPARYQWESAEGEIKDIVFETIASARGTVMVTRWVAMGRGKGRYQATLQDATGRLDLVWFNAAYLRDKIHPGMVIRVQGKAKPFNGYPQMSNPKWEPLENLDAAARQERYRPIYPATEDLPSARIEEMIATALPHVAAQLIDPLPADFLAEHVMPPLADAFRMAHRPEHEEEAAAARRRLAFNELLLLQLGIAIKKHHARTQLAAPALRWSEAIDAHIRQRFPFKLTPQQELAVGQIVEDIRQGKPMNRLLQGDVGSGKTVVALYAVLLAVANRKQGAIMVPTELLAEQHFASISAMLAGSNVRIALLTGGRLDAAERQALEADIESGKVDIVVGTQALLTESVRFNDLALVVVDEQHRFGVMQRAAFRQRDVGEGAGEKSVPPADGRIRSPHCLVMTATPIPRTLSLTIFGDLDISTITGLPPGRTPITTRVVGADKADEVYRYLAGRVAKGEQAYVVVPAIDEAGKESLKQLKNVRAHAELLQDKYGAGLRVAAVHGQLERSKREEIMQAFRASEVHILVATTVIEVGVDVPNASLMVVEHAERFGLAQLHQLRGRIGRGANGRKSLCVFVAEPVTEEAIRRMAAIGGTTDGFKIAEEDLSIRGMGDFFGTRQHGLPPLRVARIPEDIPLLQLARRDAHAIVEADAGLVGDRWRLLRKVLIQQYGDTLGLIDVG